MTVLFLISLSNFMNKNGSGLSYDHPKVMAKLRRIGTFNGSCFVPKMQQAFTATTNGIFQILIINLIIN